MIKIRDIHINLLEQASYSASRYAFWVITPILFTENWSMIAALSLVNMLEMAVYSSILGGPSYYRLVRGDSHIALSSYFVSNIILFFLSMSTFIVFIGFSQSVLDQPFSDIIVLAFFPWISISSDWSRKVHIVLGRHRVQTARNFIVLSIWVVFSMLIFTRRLPATFVSCAIVFCLICALVYLPLRGAFKEKAWNHRLVMTPFSVWRHYLIAGVVAYFIGNAVFWMSLNNKMITEFVIFRNYLNAVLILGLFMESYGSLSLQRNPQNRWNLFSRYLFWIGLLTLCSGCISFFVLPIFKKEAIVSPEIAIFVMITTFIIAAIKFPLVYLRLAQRDHLVTFVYLLVLPVWPLIYFFKLLPMLPFLGIEILCGQYFFLLIFFTWFAFRSEIEKSAICLNNPSFDVQKGGQ